MSTLSNLTNSANSLLPSLTGSTGTTGTTGSTSSSTTGAASSQQLAGNFDTFLQLLTTQLQNQDPLDPLDTDQFTQQLVEFASVEQEIDTNTNMQTMIGLQQTSNDTSAMQFLGSNVTVNSSTGTLSNATSSAASWTINSASPATGAVTITSSNGQVAFTGTTSLNTGNNTYTWNGQGNNAVTWPDGQYTIAVTASGASGSAVTVTTQTQGTVSAVNVSQNPPTITVGGQSYPISSIVSINNGGSSSALNSLSSNITSLNSSINSLAQLL
jgi:flagellar basal-body rod modification protein FlgD